MLLRLYLYRVLTAILLVLTVAGIDWLQKPAPPGPANAVWPADAAGLQGNGLKRESMGHIPMPANVAAAHASSLLAMPPGHSASVTAFWFAGDRESAPNVQIAASQFDRASQTWRAARFVVNRHTMGEQLGFGLRRLGNPVAWIDGTGRMHLFVVATGWGGWAAGRILHLVQSSATSELEDLHFVPVRVLPLSWLWNTSFLARNNPLPLADGGMELPVYFEIGVKYPAALRFDAQGNFVAMERISQRHYSLQPALVMQSPQHWLALMRDHRPDGHVLAAQTLDGGQHWSDLPDLALVNPDAALNGIGLPDASMVLVHNSTPHSRSALAISSSVDGVHWTTLATLASGPESDEYSYPGLTWADGAVWVSYTDQRKFISWQRLVPVQSSKERP